MKNVDPFFSREDHDNVSVWPSQERLCAEPSWWFAMSLFLPLTYQSSRKF